MTAPKHCMPIAGAAPKVAGHTLAYLLNVRVHVRFEGAQHSKPYRVRDHGQAYAYALADFPGCDVLRIEAEDRTLYPAEVQS